MEKKIYRFVLSVGGRLTYYKGEILSETTDSYTISEYKLGKIDIMKCNLVTKRVLVDE